MKNVFKRDTRFCLAKRNFKIKLKTITIFMKYDDGEEAAKNGRILWKSYNLLWFSKKVSISIRGYPYKKGRFLRILILLGSRSRKIDQIPWWRSSKNDHISSKYESFIFIFRKMINLSNGTPLQKVSIFDDFGTFRIYIEKNRSNFMMKEQ